MISIGRVVCLRGRSIQYERNDTSSPLVDLLSDKAGRAATREGISTESI
jgi:hypothetical protein